MWSAYILPYMEAENIRKLVEINYGSNVNYAYPGPFYTYPVANNNLEACETVIPVYRCPSTDQPEHIADQGDGCRLLYPSSGSWIVYRLCLWRGD